MEQTHILGKDAPLEASIQLMQKRLKSLGFTIEEKNWLNPIPNVWSVHIRDRTCPLLFTNGKGRSKKAALASALGEFFERLGCNYFFADYYFGQAIVNRDFVHYPEERWFPDVIKNRWPDDILADPKLRQFYNPSNELEINKLHDINSGHLKRGICTLPYSRQKDQKTIWFPINIIANLYVSNGMSAGNSPSEARVQALSEIFERYVKFQIIREGISLPTVPNKVLARYPQIQAGIKKLEASGFSIWVRDASLGGRYPVMVVTLLNPHDQGCYASFGAHPCFEIALERALTELLQGRALKALSGFPPPSSDLEEVASPENIETHFIDSSGLISWGYLRTKADYNFCNWDFSGSTEEEFSHLCQLIHAEDKDIYIADYQHLGIYACRIIVPSMSEIYPVDELIWQNNNAGNDVRKIILNLPNGYTNQWQKLFEYLEKEGFDNQQPVSALLGLATDAKQIWSWLRIGELKAMLTLALKQPHLALENCEWLLHYQSIPAERQKIYRCIVTLLRLDLETLDGLQEGLLRLYGEESLKLSIELVNAEHCFWGIEEAPTETLNGLKMHQRLLQAYEKLQKARRNYVLPPIKKA